MVAPSIVGCPVVPEEPLDSCSRLLAQSPSAHSNILSTCDMLSGNLFQACHVAVERQKYVDMCRKSMCQCQLDGNANCEPCQVFASYSRECARKGVVLSWRSKDLCRKYEFTLTKNHFKNLLEGLSLLSIWT